MDRIDCLKAFVRAMEAGSFSLAAKELGLGQPAISKRIALLEREFGSQLFMRTTRKLTPTREAHRVYDLARQVLSTFETARASIKETPAKPAGTLRISVPSSFGRHYLMPIVKDYVREYPERLHHPKEDRYLFSALRACTREGDSVLEELELEHEQGEALLNALTVALSTYEAGADPRCERLGAQVDEFAAFYWSHMRKEEDIVLPLAERVLSDGDWSRIHAEFAQNRDPSFGGDDEAQFRQLFSRIVNLMPAPLGLG